MGDLQHTPLKPLIGSEIQADRASLISGDLGIDLRALLLERGVLVFRDLALTPDEQRDITASIGPLAPGTLGDGLNKISADRTEAPELADYVETTFLWHLDGAIAQTMPCLGGSFRPIRLAPHGGQTEVIDTVGAVQFDDNAGLLAEGGQLSGIGMLGSDFSWTKPEAAAVLKPIAVGSRTQHEAMVRFMVAHGIHPVVDAVYDLDRLVEAYRLLESGQFFGKIGINLR